MYDKEVMAVLRALTSGTSGLNAQQTKVDTLANNLANINTTGFKRSRAEFSELIDQELEKGGIPVGAGNQNVTLGSGVYVAGVVKDFKPGGIIETGQPLDLAIQGEGFFKVLTPGGEERYTRDGSFSLDQEGNLVITSGCKLDGIQLEPGSNKIAVSPEGTVKAGEADSATEAGQITLYRFTNMNGLKAEGENLFSLDQAAGAAVSGNPGSEGFGSLRQGALETANVDLVEEMANLIEAQRAYGFTSRTVRTADEMWGLANNMRK